KYEAVVDFGADHADNQFKVTGEAGWNNGNWGVANVADLETAERASIQLADGSNDNITCYTANRYYNFTFSKSSLVLTKVNGFDQVGIIGLNGDWENDIVMTLDSKQRFYADIDVAANTEFKFRLDGTWGTNWGVDGIINGNNIPIEAGQYRIYLDINNYDKVTYSISAEDFGKEDGGNEGGEIEDPLPEGAEPVNVICADPGWDNSNLYGWGMKTAFNWPGLEMSKATLGGKAYWYYTLGKENWGSTGVGLIFNNGSVQTVDISVATLDGVKCFTLGEIVDGKYTYAEMAESERPVVKITYKNEAGWTAVSLYGWGEGCDFSLGDWPGSSMTKEGEDIWTYSIPAENIGKNVKLIFNNNGGGAQTVDLGPFTLNQDWYFDNSNATIK
ncbi:MAG: starch-binding protein, partial [Candidatus Cryptobacteroides sp.]